MPAIAVGPGTLTMLVVFVNTQPLASCIVTEYVPGAKPVVGDVADNAPPLIA